MKKLSIICLALMALLSVSCNKTVVTNNVSSLTVTVYPSEWRWDNTSWRANIKYEAITPNITDYGAVLVYMDSEGTWRQIPMTFYYSQQNEDGTTSYYSSSIEVSTYDNGVSIFWTENDFYDGYRPDTHRFKIVVIPAAVYSSRSDVNYEDYNAVKTAFQLDD